MRYAIDHVEFVQKYLDGVFAEDVHASATIVVAMDDADDQATLALSLLTNHGRATPLFWLTVLKDELKDQRNDFEDLCLARLAEVQPKGVAVTILAPDAIHYGGACVAQLRTGCDLQRCFGAMLAASHAGFQEPQLRKLLYGVALLFCCFPRRGRLRLGDLSHPF